MSAKYLSRVKSGIIDFPMHLVMTEDDFRREDREKREFIDVFLHDISADYYMCNSARKESKAKVLAMAYSVREVLRTKRGMAKLDRMLGSIRLERHIRRGYKRKALGVGRARVMDFFAEVKNHVKKIPLPKLVLDRERTRKLFGTDLSLKK